MSKKKEYLLEIIFKKLKKSSKKIKLEEKEFTEFINFLIKNNQ